MTNTPMTKEAFENAWRKIHTGISLDDVCERLPSGEYKGWITQQACLLWQAALAHSQKLAERDAVGVACGMCPNNRDVVCGMCEGSGIVESDDGFKGNCPSGCSPKELVVFNRKDYPLFGRYVSYTSSKSPIEIGTKLYTSPPNTNAIIAATLKKAADVCERHEQNMLNHGESALAEQSRQDKLAILSLLPKE